VAFYFINVISSASSLIKNYPFKIWSCTSTIFSGGMACLWVHVLTTHTHTHTHTHSLQMNVWLWRFCVMTEGCSYVVFWFQALNATVCGGDTRHGYGVISSVNPWSWTEMDPIIQTLLPVTQKRGSASAFP